MLAGQCLCFQAVSSIEMELEAGLRTKNHDFECKGLAGRSRDWCYADVGIGHFGLQKTYVFGLVGGSANEDFLSSGDGLPPISSPRRRKTENLC